MFAPPPAPQSNGGMPRPLFPPPPGAGPLGARPPFPGAGPGMPLPPGGLPPGMPPPPGSAGFPKPPLEQQMKGLSIGAPGAPMQANGHHGPAPMGPPGSMPPPPAGPASTGSIMGRPPPPGMAPMNGPPGFGGPPPPPGGFQGPPAVPSSGTPINMPAHMAPPSQNSGMLAGIPAAARAPNGVLGGAGSSILGNGPAAGGPPGMPPPPGMRLSGSGSGMMPPPPPGMVPPGQMSMGPPGSHFPPPPPGLGMPPPPGMPGAGQMGPPPPPGFRPPPGAGPAPGGSGGGARIDTAAIPRPQPSPLTTTATQFDTRVGGHHAAPPPAASRFAVRDCGSAGPRYMRSSLNQVPHTAELLNNSQVPFALVVSPLALPDPLDDSLQVVDHGPLGPVRCSRCKAYMNPYMRFMQSGRSFTCNFCGASTPTPDAYYCPLGPDGRRFDAHERPELSRGSVEWAATPEYMLRPPMVSSHFFLIDVSQAAVASGATATTCSVISHALEHIPFPERSQVGLAAFDTAVHFFAVKGGEAQPQLLVMSDVNDVFAPGSAPLLVNASTHREGLQKLLGQIPDMYAQTNVRESCAGAAIEAAVSLLQPTGGKVHAFLSTLPSLGLHALKVRDGITANPDKDKLTFLASQDNTCKSLAMTAAEGQVCIDIALLSQSYLDAATWTDLVAGTGGTLYSYANFNPGMDHDQVLNDLKWNLVRPQGLEAVMRVRCSQGLDVSSYSGHFFRMPQSPTDVFLPAIDSDKSLVAVLQHTEKLQPGAECYVQAALLYTTLDGQRRIRVHTLALPVTDNISSVFKGSDLDAYICHMGRRLAGQLPGLTLSAARESVTGQVVATLGAYRKYCASNSSAVQLILPESLKLLPLYALAFLKGQGLKDGAKPDERSLWCASMMSLPAARITPLLYPRLLAFHQLLEAGGVEELGGLPEGLVASAEALQRGGVYLLENGHDAYLYVDKDVPPKLLEDLLGVASYEELCRTPGQFPLLPRETPASKELQALLTKVRIHRSSFMRLRVARKGDAAEVAFFNGLVEDRSTAGLSYVEYLCQVHRLIQGRNSS